MDSKGHMEIYSLVGKSGTGKSFQANSLCARLGIDSIIDDGLFIENGRIHAGKSAKRQATKIGAIKTALFKDAAQRSEVLNAIRKVSPKSILIIGTSDGMVDKIAAGLELSRPEHRMYIEEITTEDEREAAHKRRYESGEHVIPAPTFQIKKDFSGYFIHPIKSIKDLTDDFFDAKNPFVERDIRNPFAERSVVRPTYSYLGNYSISDKAINDIVMLSAKDVETVCSITRVFVRNRSEGAIVEVDATVRYGVNVIDSAEALQRVTAEKVEEMTSINILEVDVRVIGLN
jgi:uncharacterized alkaline shock family protein YloU/adenylate kinase family enzyme